MKVSMFLTMFTLGMVLQAAAIACPPDTTVSVTDKGKIQALLITGRDKQFSKDWLGAMADFKKILEIHPTHATAHFRIAECHYNIYKWQFALEYLEKAYQYDPEVNKEYHYMMGLVKHRLGKPEEAVVHFEKFKPLAGEGMLREYMVEKHIKDCSFAIEATKNPTSAKVKNPGPIINTRFRDYQPVVTADEQTMYFTSRRNDTKGGGIAKDFAFFEDIYVAKRDASTGQWTQPVHLPGKVNSESHESVSSINAAGTEMYLTVYAGDSRIADLAVSKKREDESWSDPKPYPKKTINTTFFEASITLTEDGKTMYFVAERLNGKGRSDIYRSTQISKKEWSKPENISILNTEDDENSVYVTPDGKYLFFSSNGLPGVGGYDIYISKNENGTWSAPVNLGYPVNSVNDDFHFKPNANFTKAYMTSVREDSEGLHDIYEVDLSGYDIRGLAK